MFWLKDKHGADERITKGELQKVRDAEVKIKDANISIANAGIRITAIEKYWPVVLLDVMRTVRLWHIIFCLVLIGNSIGVYKYSYFISTKKTVEIKKDITIDVVKELKDKLQYKALYGDALDNAIENMVGMPVSISVPTWTFPQLLILIILVIIEGALLYEFFRRLPTMLRSFFNPEYIALRDFNKNFR